MPCDAPFKTVIAGGGAAALEAILALRELAPVMELELIAPEADYVYGPLSVVEPFARAGLRRYPYERLADLGVAVRHDALLAVVAQDRSLRTAGGVEVRYDALLVAVGARLPDAELGGLTFKGPDAVERMHGLVQDLEGGYLQSIVFAAPTGANWTLPLYELALQTAERAYDMDLDSVRIAIVSHEARPLELFGLEASERMEAVLEDAGITFTSGSVLPPADRLVVLPVPAGQRFDGLPADAAGFLPVDGQGRVDRVAGVWAAGDGSSFSSIKQGGLATQQAEVAARSIAIAAGCDVAPGSFEPVLRGMLVTGRHALHLNRRLDGEDVGEISASALWSPPSKIAGRRLAPFLDALDVEPGLERRLEAAGAKVANP